MEVVSWCKQDMIQADGNSERRERAWERRGALLMRSEICRLLWRQEVQRNPLVPVCGRLSSDKTHASSCPKSTVSMLRWHREHLVNAECL